MTITTTNDNFSFPVDDTEEVKAIQKDFCYNGKRFLKLPNLDLPITEEQKQEVIKCFSDIIYFTNNYVRIATITDGIKLFKTYEFQKNMINHFNDNRFSIAMLPRQMGKTTTVVAFALHYALTHPDSTIAILGNKERTAIEILARLKFAYEQLPWYMKPGVVEWNKKSILLANGERGVSIFAASCSADSVRGRSLSVAILDEFSFVPQAEDFYESTYPTISSSKDSKIIIVSTPKGMNLFYQLWKGAEKGSNNYKHFFAPYWEHPDRDEGWAETQRGNMTEQRFNQEFLCEFIGSSATLINTKTLKNLDSIEPQEEDGSLKKYKLPFPGHRYVITVDTGEGTTRDYSVATVFDVTNNPTEESKKAAAYEQVAVFRNNKILPESFAQVILQIAHYYNDAFILPENNSIGKIVGDTLYHDFEYENILTSYSKGGETEVREGSTKLSIGLRQTAKTKAIGCSRLKSILESGLLEINDSATIGELFTFVKEKNSYQAEQGKHDDIAMTLVMFGWLTQTDKFKELTGMIDASLREKLEDRDVIPASLLSQLNPHAGDVWGSVGETMTDAYGNTIQVVRNSQALQW